jgi:hypothetical protein
MPGTITHTIIATTVYYIPLVRTLTLNTFTLPLTPPPHEEPSLNTTTTCGSKDCTLNPKHLNPKHLNPKHLNPKHLNPKHLNPKHLNPKHLNGLNP